jgi:hypothetical protein
MMQMKRIEWNEQQVLLFRSLIDQVIKTAPDSRMAAQQLEPLAKSVDDAPTFLDRELEETTEV